MSATATLKMLLLGEDKSASSALTHAGDTAEKTGKKFNLLGGHSTLLGHKFGSLSKIAGGVFAGGAMLQGGEMAIDLLKDSAKAAAADEKENAVLAKQMKNVAGARDEDVKATQEWVKKQAEAYGISKDKLTPSLTKLVTATHDTAKAQGLLKLAMNVSAGTGKDLNVVTMALAKAQNGSTGGLAKLGVATKDASGKALTFDQIQKNLAKTFKGDAATAADTAQGRMKRLSVTWDEMKVTLGEKLLPILIKFAGFMLNNVIPVVMKVSGVISRHTSLMVAVGIAVGLLVGGPLVALAAAFVILWTRSDKFRTVMTAAFHGVAAAGTWMWNNALEPALKLLLTAIGWVMDGWSHMLGALGHIPGFGWAKDASRVMGDAADAALRIRDNINKIPDHKNVKVNVAVVMTGKQKNAVAGLPIYNVGSNATGTPNWRGGLTWVGEQGPELADLPGGTRIWNASDSARMAAGGGGGGDGLVGSQPIVLKLDSTTVWTGLLQLKRTKGNLSLGLA
jgi:hypothetical protein